MGFTDFWRKKKKDGAETAISKLSPAIVDSIASATGVRSIPPMPGAAQKAFQLATDPNAEVRDFLSVIESDESLSARVLRIANSVYYDRGNKSSTVEEAIRVIGLDELKGLLNANTLTEIFPSPHPARTQLWANDIATALICRSLAARLMPNRTSLAFVCGLMHDIGKLLLLQRTPEDYSKVIRLVEREALDFTRAEEQVYPFDHAQVGQLIAEKWNFAPEVIEAIANHHKYDNKILGSDSSTNVEVPKSSNFSWIVYCADTIAHSLGLGQPANFHKFKGQQEAKLEAIWKSLAIAENEQRTMLSNYKRAFDLEYDLYATNY